jgi:hypothetical protein
MKIYIKALLTVTMVSMLAFVSCYIGVDKHPHHHPHYEGEMHKQMVAR